MKKVGVLLGVSGLWLACLFLVSSQAFGSWGGNVSCSYSDRGWEEHFFGHRSCGECKQKHHRCIETCRQSSYRCEAKGVRWDGGEGSAYGFSEYSRYDAENQALSNCSYQGLSNCSASCETDDRVISSGEC